MAYADYMHCPGCDDKVIYTGDRDYEDADGNPLYGPHGVVAWHEKCLTDHIAERIAAERDLIADADDRAD